MHSTYEAKVYAMDESMKLLQHVTYIVEDLNLKSALVPEAIPVLNSNHACDHWSSNLSIKGL
eukprot:12448034-Ditylum_brightwellii.AAC.1